MRVGRPRHHLTFDGSSSCPLTFAQHLALASWPQALLHYIREGRTGSRPTPTVRRLRGRSPDPRGSGVRYDLAHLDVLDRDRVGNQRRDPLAHGLGGLLRLEDDHAQSLVVRSCPVPRYEPWGLRYAGNNVLAQLARGGLSV